MTVITLCGSTRFPEAHRTAEMHEAFRGNVVVPLSVFGHVDEPRGSRFLCADGDEKHPGKRGLDEVHFRKIDLCDEVLVVNVGGYVGSSTEREIAYALSHGKRVRVMFDEIDLDDSSLAAALARHFAENRSSVRLNGDVIEAGP